MSNVLSTGGRANAVATPATSLRIQTSIYGKTIPILYGVTRLAGNLIWYGDFTQIASGGGGKGNVAGAKGGQTTYSAAVAISLCEGPVSGVEAVWVNQTGEGLAQNNLSLFSGSSAQTAWSYIESTNPSQALNYRNNAYVAGIYQLGNDPSLPNLNFLIVGAINSSVGGQQDCDPSLVLVDYLTNPNYGCGFPADRIGDLSSFSAFCRAYGPNGLLISDALVDQQAAQEYLKNLFDCLVCAPVWSGGLLTVVPYADQTYSNNGATYNPPAAPIYALTDDDYLDNQNSNQQGVVDPVSVTRKSPYDVNNDIKVEFLDNQNQYNPAIAEATDDQSILTYTKRPADTKTAHFFTNATTAGQSAGLMLAREQIKNVYTITLGAWAILLDPMDVVSLTDASLGLNGQWVRITQIQENDDYSLTFTAEEYLNGAGAAPVFPAQGSIRYSANTNADPGSINPPIIFEPTDELGGGLEIWTAVSGQNLTTWGGCDVYASLDGTNYTYQTTVSGAARMGATTAVLAPVTPAASGQTIDQTNTLAVNVAESGAQLASASLADATALTSACYVGGEIIAYETAQLTGAGQYALSYLVRGAYGTESEIVSHPAGTPFARLDAGIAKVPYNQAQIGATVYLKFCSFNTYGGGKQSLAEVGAFPYTITGAALSSPLPNVANLRTSYVDNVFGINWDQISDFRSGILYEVRLGASWADALTLGQVASPPFPVRGDGTYWVAAVCQPAAGLIVYSETPASIDIAGAVLSQYVVISNDEQAQGWPGVFGGTVAVSGSNIQTGFGGNLLAETNILADSNILALGSQAGGTYTQGSAHFLDLGYPRTFQVDIQYVGSGEPVGQNILAEPNILAMPDFLGSASTALVDVHPEISLTNTTPDDVYALADAYAVPDVYAAGINFITWQKFDPGSQLARACCARMVLNPLDPNTVAICQAFKVSFYVEARIDIVSNATIPATGLTIQFTPAGQSTPAPFIGGPYNGGTVQGLPAITVDWPNQSGDELVITGLSLSQVTIEITNGGGGVTRTGATIYAEGY